MQHTHTQTLSIYDLYFVSILYSYTLQFDYDHYSELISDMKWLEAKKAGSRARQKKTARVGWGSARETLSSSEERWSEGGRGRGRAEGGEGERELVGFFSAGETEVSLDDLDDDGSESTAKLKVNHPKTPGFFLPQSMVAFCFFYSEV